MKHEKALLVALAYVIGFITAFIAFAINDADKKADQATQVVMEKDAETNTSQMMDTSGIKAMVTDDGLYMVKNGKERILSAHVAYASGKAGFHDSIANTATSPDGRFIFYCAVLEAGDENCVSYIYSVENDVVHKVVIGTEMLMASAIDIENANWSDDGLLHIGTMSSVSDSSPWMMK